MTQEVLLSVGKGMILYLCIARVGLEGSHRKMFLWTYVISEGIMLVLYNISLI